MLQRLANKHILVGVTGGIAAYKSADLVRRLRDAGADVRVVMTAKAKEFITPLTMQAVSGHPVHDDLFDLQAEAAMGHIELARWADVILVAPASADFMARLVHGEANDLLTTLCLARTGQIALAPAMNQAMWKNTLTQQNVQALHQANIKVLGPAEGSQACGDIGLGRMVEPHEIVQDVCQMFATGSLAGRHVVITAGPTREAIDPVRYITNASSGKMGYAMADAAIEAGAKVTLISGPVALAKPLRANCIDVVSAEEMFEAVMRQIAACDIFISVAAVADYRCKQVAVHKMKKEAGEMQLSLERNKDIVQAVAALPDRPYVVGFAAETENLMANAKTKLVTKKLDMIIANQVGDAQSDAYRDDNAVTVIWKDTSQDYARMAKTKLARELIALIANSFNQQGK